MLYNIVLASATYQHESAIGIHMNPYIHTSPYIHMSSIHTYVLPPPPTAFHSSRLSQSTRFELPASYSKFPLVIYFTNGNVYISMTLYQIIPPFSSPTMSKNLLFFCASPLLHCKEDHQYHLSRFHICELIHNICFSLSDLLHSV